MRFAEPPSTFPRSLGSSERADGRGRLVDAPASLPWPSPLLQGFHPRPPCRVAPAGVARGTPLVGFFALQHLPDPRVHLHGVSRPRYVPSSGFRPSRRLAPREPSRPYFRSERSWALALQGFLPHRSAGTSREARHLHDVGRLPSAPPAAVWNALVVLRSASPSSRLLVPGVLTFAPAVTPPAKARSPPGLLLPEVLPPLIAPLRPAAIPPWASRRPSSLRSAAASTLRGLLRRGTWPDSGSRATSSRFLPLVVKEPSLGRRSSLVRTTLRSVPRRVTRTRPLNADL
jgi:hypothetical protein